LSANAAVYIYLLLGKLQSCQITSAQRCELLQVSTQTIITAKIVTSNVIIECVLRIVALQTLSVEPHDASYPSQVQIFENPSRERPVTCVCCGCGNLLTNDLGVWLYCLPTDACF